MKRAFLLVAVCSFALPVNAQDPTVVVAYDSATGELSMSTQQPITTFQLASKAGSLNGIWPSIANGPFDGFHPYKLFLLDVEGFDNAEFGPVFHPGLGVEFLLNDICLEGSFKGGGGFAGKTLFLVDGQAVNPHNSLNCNSVGSADGTREVRMEYVPATGELLLSDLDGLDHLKSINLASPTNIFTEGNFENLNGPFDVQTPHRFVKVDPNGFQTLSFGSVLPPDFEVEALAEQFCGSTTDEYRSTRHDLFINDLKIDSCRPQFKVNQIIAEDPPGHIGFHYDKSTGELLVNVADGTRMSAVEIFSETGIFTGEPSDEFRSQIDEASPTKLFKIDTRGFEDVSLGKIVEPGLSEDFLLGDICVRASFKGIAGRVDTIHLNSDVDLPITCGSRPSVSIDGANARLFVGEEITEATLELDGVTFAETLPIEIAPFATQKSPTRLVLDFPDGNEGLIDLGELFPSDVAFKSIQNSVSVRAVLANGSQVESFDVVQRVHVPEPSRQLTLIGLIPFLLRRRAAAAA